MPYYVRPTPPTFTDSNGSTWKVTVNTWGTLSSEIVTQGLRHVAIVSNVDASFDIISSDVVQETVTASAGVKAISANTYPEIVLTVVPTATPAGYQDYGISPVGWNTSEGSAEFYFSLIQKTKIDTFSAVFDTLDGFEFTNSEAIQPVIESGQLKLSADYSISEQSSGIQSVDAYDLTDSSVFCKVTPSLLNQTHYLLAMINNDTSHQVIAYLDSSHLYLRTYDGNNVVEQDVGPYDPVAHQWVRLRNDGVFSQLDTSPNGFTWTQRSETDTSAADLSNLRVWWYVQTGAQDVPNTLYVDNLNVGVPDPNAVDLAIWQIVQGSPVVVDGRIQLAENGSPSNRDIIMSVESVTAGSVKFKLDPGNFSDYAYSIAGLATNNDYYNYALGVMFRTVGSVVITCKRNNNSNTNIAEFAYDPIEMAWWRMSYLAPEFVVESSPDGSTWTERASHNPDVGGSAYSVPPTVRVVASGPQANTDALYISNVTMVGG